MLEIKDLDAGYGFLQVLRGVSLSVKEGEFVALVGPNGAGKTTTLRTIAGLIEPTAGQIRLNGEPINGMPAHLISSKMRISFISESLNLFTGMTVQENILVGAHIVREKQRIAQNIELVYHLFPRLKERTDQLAGTLSGGERKMLAIGRGLMSNPELLLVDEPSLGLAPMLTMDVFRTLETLRRERGVTILLVEQNVNTTLKITDRAYVLEQGQVVLQGGSKQLLQDNYIKTAYLGL